MRWRDFIEAILLWQARLGLLSAALSFLSTPATAQPTPLGPPPNQTQAGFVPVAILTSLLRANAQMTVDDTNARLQSQGKSERTSIDGITQFKPNRTATDLWNRPNSWYVRAPYILRIKVAIPYSFDRYIDIPIDLNVFCDNWYTANGTIIVRSSVSPASIEGGNILEDVINIRDYIDAQVRSAYNPPAPVNVPLSLETIKCAALGVSDSGTADPSDDVVFWDPPPKIPPAPRVQPTVSVTFDRIKRLTAHEPGGAVVYQDVEEILLNLFANYSHVQRSFTMREGDDIPLNIPPVFLDPLRFDTLVILGNVDQPPNNPKDSAFATTAKSENYAPGPHVLPIPKWYSLPPNRFDPKPSLISVPAYELNYTVWFSKSDVLR